MNWEAIGSIGEAVGSAFVLISLLYLAVQVRQNTAGLLLSVIMGFALYGQILNNMCLSLMVFEWIHI